MQPPPRKVKATQDVKLAFAEQVNKLQNKNQQETDLLEELRSFSKQRATIEKEYGQALQRLSSQYMKRDWSRGKAEPGGNGSVYTLWRCIVEATAQMSVSRTNAAENYRSLSNEAAKTLRAAKEQRLKKSLEQMQRVQGELVEEVRDLNKIKKRYCQLQRIADIACEKASDAQSRSKRNDHGIFHFRTTLHKLNTKLSARLSECNLQLTEARNEYLLTLAAVNAHQEHYQATSLPALMKALDGDLFDRLRDHFTLLSQTELDTCQATQTFFCKILNNSNQVSRDQNLQIFLQDNPTFFKAPAFTFQAAPNDKVGSLVHQSSGQGESCLEKEARKWASKAAKGYKIATHGERVLQTMDKRKKQVSEDEAATLELRMEEVRESIRKAQVDQLKANARLDLLRSAGADVDPWVASSFSQANEELEKERRMSEARLSNGDISPMGAQLEFTDFEDFDDAAETFTDSPSKPACHSYPLPCQVLYSYQACQADELSITEGEHLEIIEDGDMEDWLKARNQAGQVGYVPEKYLHILSVSARDVSSQKVPESSHFDQTSDISESSQGSQEYRGLARALYEYCGQSAEELSFPEGAIIRLLRSRDGDVDDGFWEGEVNGRIGVFPSLVVELLGEGDEDEEEELSSPTPPPFSPPFSGPGGATSPVRLTSSARSTPTRGLEERLQMTSLDSLRISDSKTECGSSAHSSPDLSVRRLRPMRAPPLPPGMQNEP
ncbi:F-BAR and double SH3 domains protein 1-like isoform X1 [Erpetoichthys calabaricus]|uniref:Uncharacterized protein n=1 Tax=Erpetoichthys calabaricus TaxID=27687 RepID=A0A8C4XGF7_ERPCA|nr:F-BAR and double SH3 domains protein 1-like isoform X1 [Erpetoichthys calabaricus]